MSNTLLSLDMILAKAMVMARNAAPSDTFEIVAEFEFPSTSLTLSIDQFTDDALGPAIAAGMTDRRPLSDHAPFARTDLRYGDMETVIDWAEKGVVGRLRRSYDISKDAMPCRIEIRAWEPLV